MRLATTLEGHFWTIAADARTRLSPPTTEANPWSLQVADAGSGPSPIELSGALDERADADTLIVIVHGLGGSAHSSASVRAAAAAATRGWSSLRVSLRGADGRGHDIYHAGLVEDIWRVLDCATARRHDRVLLYGASLGGHQALFHALDPHPRLGAVAAVCPPLDLAATASWIDRGRCTPYRRAILRALKRGYRAFAARNETPFPLEQVEAVDRVREWDRLVVVPRFGFGTVERYYATMSVGPRLGQIRVPTLYMGAASDPMVPLRSVQPSLAVAGAPLDARMRRRGGHLGFPSSIEDRVLDWLGRAA